MYKLKKDIFLKFVAAVVVVLFIVRLIWPEVNGPSEANVSAPADSLQIAALSKTESNQVQDVESEDSIVVIREEVLTDSMWQHHAPRLALLASEPLPRLDFTYAHPIKSVPSYSHCFPDVQDVQYPAALACGVPPVANRGDAEHRKKDLLYVGANPYYIMDPAMSRSIPYLVPKASHLLQHIGRRFLDSLAVKRIPLHTIIVTSVLRTEEDVTRLRRINGNASEQSCHRFGTTFDISYNRYHTVAPPDDPHRRPVRNDSLKFVLSEVLRDVRSEGLCYVKYEVKQGCYHITVR